MINKEKNGFKNQLWTSTLDTSFYLLLGIKARARWLHFSEETLQIQEENLLPSKVHYLLYIMLPPRWVTHTHKKKNAHKIPRRSSYNQAGPTGFPRTAHPLVLCCSSSLKYPDNRIPSNFPELFYKWKNLHLSNKGKKLTTWQSGACSPRPPGA